MANYQVQVNLLKTLGTDTSVVNLEAESVSKTRIGGYALVQGKIRNAYSSPVLDPIVLVTLRNSKGMVVGTDYVRIFSSLAPPNQEAEFVVYIAIDPNLDIDSLSLEVQVQSFENP